MLFEINPYSREFESPESTKVPMSDEQKQLY